MRQLVAEFARFFARRIVRMMFLVAVLLVVLIVTIGTAKGHAARERTFDPSAGQFVGPSSGQGFVQPGNSGDGSFVVIESDTRTNIGKDLNKALEGTGVALLFAGFAIGASFVGAEFNVGSMTTQLMYEPRRWLLHTSKAVAVAAGTALFTFGVLAFLALAMFIGSATHGVLQGVDRAFAVHRLGEALRIAAVVGAGASMAYCATLVTRRSSAGMIAFYTQYPLLFLLDPAKMPFGLLSHYEPLRGILAVIVDPAGATGTYSRTIHTMAGGAVLTVVWTIVVFAAAGAAFARAEVR